jgi:hypothetical protein
MRLTTKSYIALVVTTLALCATVASASANRLSVSNRFFRLTWASLEFEVAGTTTRCPITLEGSFHSSTFRKIEEALVGNVTRGLVNGARPPCTGATTTILAESLPWHIRYGGFIGALPNISRLTIRVIGFTLRIDFDGILPPCLLRTTTENPARFFLEREAGGAIAGVSSDPSSSIPLSNGFGCGVAEATYAGTARFTVLNSATRVTLTLI